MLSNLLSGLGLHPDQQTKTNLFTKVISIASMIGLSLFNFTPVATLLHIPIAATTVSSVQGWGTFISGLVAYFTASNTNTTGTTVAVTPPLATTVKV